MRLALSATTPGWSTVELADLAAWAETVGFEEVWLSEVAGPDAFVLAAAVAARTERMGLGIAVLPAYSRTPAVIAMGAGSVSQVLAGRPLYLGIGSSSETIVSDWNGLPFDRPLLRVQETVQAVRAALGGDGTFQGSTVRMTRFRSASPPVGPVQLFVGALGPRMLATAGEHGDGVCLNLMPVAAVPRQLEAVERGMQRGGRTPDAFTVMARLWVLITDDGRTVRRHLAQTILSAYLAQPVYNRFLAWCGYPEEAEAIAGAWAARDRPAMDRALHDQLVAALTVIGTEREVLDRLDGFAESGVGVAALHVASSDREEIQRTLTRLRELRG